MALDLNRSGVMPEGSGVVGRTGLNTSPVMPGGGYTAAPYQRAGTDLNVSPVMPGGGYKPGDPYQRPATPTPAPGNTQPDPTVKPGPYTPTTPGTQGPVATPAGPAPMQTMTQAYRPDVGSFMNEYLAGAMQPTLDKIMEKGAIDRSRIGSQAASSGAFGDARHGVMERGQVRDENQLLTDTVAQMLSRGFDTGMGNAQQYAGRQQEADTVNAGLQGQAIDRDMGWNQYLMGLDQTEKDRALRAIGQGNEMDLSQNQQMMQWMKSQADFDNYLRGWNQQGLNTKYDDYMQQQLWPITIMNMLRGSQTAPATTQPKDNSIWGAIGGGISDWLF